MIPQGHVLALASLSLLATNGAGHAPQGAVRPSGGTPNSVQVDLSQPAFRPSLRFELPKQSVTLPDGQVADFGAHELWRPMCSGPVTVTPEQLNAMAVAHQGLAQHPVRIIDTTSAADVGSFNVVFVASGSIPPGAAAALAASEAYIESFFSDSITITINVSFQPLGPGILGGTSSSYGFVNWSPARTQIVGDMDASDTLQAFLPTGTTFPVRYGAGNAVTNETRLFFTFANWKAVDGTIAGADANMTFSTNFAFDYDPSNGITAGSYSFTDVVIHETGHAMGFTSGGDFRVNDSECLDLFRFQRTDGSSDNNPDTTAEFNVRPRRVSFNAPNDDLSLIHI